MTVADIFPTLNPRQIRLCILKYKLLSKGVFTFKSWITNNVEDGPILLKFRVNHDTMTVTSTSTIPGPLN